jgi:hypothetical protein
MRHHVSATRLVGRLLGIAISLPLAFMLFVSPVALANGGGYGGYGFKKDTCCSYGG